MKINICIGFLVMCLYSCSSVESSPTCDMKKLFEESYLITGKNLNPQTVFKYHEKIQQCKAMDGVVASSFREISTGLMEKKWKALVVDKSLAVTSYVDNLVLFLSEGTPKKSFDKICKNSKAHCKSNQEFCSKIINRCVELRKKFKRR